MDRLLNLHGQLTEAANTIGSLLKTEVENNASNYRVYYKRLDILIKGIEADFKDVPVKEIQMPENPSYVKQCMQLDDK